MRQGGSARLVIWLEPQFLLPGQILLLHECVLDGRDAHGAAKALLANLIGDKALGCHGHRGVEVASDCRQPLHDKARSNHQGENGLI